jgi:hypothetical protein
LENANPDVVYLTDWAKAMKRSLGFATLPTMSLLFTGWDGEFTLLGVTVTAAKAAPAWIATALICSIWVQLQVRALTRNLTDTQIARWGMVSILVTAARSYPTLFRWTLPALPLVMLSVALADVCGSPPQVIIWCLVLCTPLIGSEASVDALELALKKTSRSGRRLSLPELLLVWSTVLATASLPVFTLLALGAAARGATLPPGWVAIAYAVTFSPVTVAVVFFPLVEDWGRGSGHGETDPGAPIAKGWKFVRRAAARWFRV